MNQLDAIALHWRRAPRRWGHPLHSLCSYFAMFPPHVPRVFIEWLTRSGDVVYDPFSGRGTAPLEACRLGRLGFGSDANPLACVLTAAKVDPPEINHIEARLLDIRRSVPSSNPKGVHPDIRMLYAPDTLRQLCWLRDTLNLHDRTDVFIMATVLGMLHANYKPGSPPRGFSISMPNTFSMAPAYIRKYIDQHHLKPPVVDVFDMIDKKVKRLNLPNVNATRGMAWQADAREPMLPFQKPVRLVFTSPPYLSVIKYGKYNWIRLWMLKYEPRQIDAGLVATSSINRYLEFMKGLLLSMASVLSSNGYLSLMIGDVADKRSGLSTNLAERVWKDAAQSLGWRRLGIVNDHLPVQHKVSRIWGHQKKGAATKVDRILILAPPNTSHTLPPTPAGFSWNSANHWSEQGRS